MFGVSFRSEIGWRATISSPCISIRYWSSVIDIASSAERGIHAEYNPIHNSIDINHYNGYILRIDCNLAESGIKTTPNSQRCLNALATDNPLEYARLALDGEMQAWADAEDSLDIF